MLIYKKEQNDYCLNLAGLLVSPVPISLIRKEVDKDKNFINCSKYILLSLKGVIERILVF